MPQFFIERPIFAWVVALFILLAGVLAIPSMPVSQYPNVAPPAITITATYPGASAREVAQSVTSIIEDKLNGAKGLLYYESVSDSYGTSTITATFAPGRDPDLAQVDVQNRVSNVIAQLPTTVQQQGPEVRADQHGLPARGDGVVHRRFAGPDRAGRLHRPQYPEPDLARARRRAVPAVRGAARHAHLGRSRQAGRFQPEHGRGQSGDFRAERPDLGRQRRFAA